MMRGNDVDGMASTCCSTNDRAAGKAQQAKQMPCDTHAGENDDALCAVCGGGHSEAPNCIVFCDRCDVAVHQACYDLDTLPQGAL